MRPNAALFGTLVLTLLVAGCAGVAPTVETAGEATTTTTDPTTSDAVTTVTETATEAHTTEDRATTTDDEPQKGDNLLSVSRIDNESAIQFNASRRVSFSKLSERQQEPFERALRCDCNVNQSVFSFNDTDRIKVVAYRGAYYYLRVSIV